jgi:leader peptidase (prepilin peptidase)/N-methyltransferase
LLDGLLFYSLLAGLFGLLIGSFLNVCIFRFPRDLSVVRPRSFCPECEKPIAAMDNIPVVSYLLLRGRCRHCKAKIPWRYPVVELLIGLLFFLGVYTQGLTPAALKFCIFAAIQVALIFTDLEERILPDEFTLGGTLMGIVLAWFVPIPSSIIFFFAPRTWSPQVISVAEAIFGAVFTSVSLWAFGAIYQKIRHKEGLGFGDVKMVAMLGAFFGLQGALFTLILGSLLGSIIGLFYVLFAKKDAGSYELPFGSFLALSALAVAIYGGPVLAWYAVKYSMPLAH